MHMFHETNIFYNLQTFSTTLTGSYYIENDLEFFPQMLSGGHATLAALCDSPNNCCGKPNSLFLRPFLSLAIHNFICNSMIPKTCNLTGKMSGEESLLCSRVQLLASLVRYLPVFPPQVTQLLKRYQHHCSVTCPSATLVVALACVSGAREDNATTWVHRWDLVWYLTVWSCISLLKRKTKIF